MSIVSLLRIFAGMLLLCGVAFPGLGSAATVSDPPRQTLIEIQQMIESGNPTAARQRLEEAIRQYPSSPILFNLRGALEAQSGDYVAAERDFQRSIRLDPGTEGAYLNLGRLYLQNPGNQPGALEKAESIYAKLVRLNPENVEGLYQLGLVSQFSGRYQVSAEILAKLPPDVRERPQTLAMQVVNEVGLHQEGKASETAKRLLAHADIVETDITSIIPELEKAGGRKTAIQLLAGAMEKRIASDASILQLAALYEDTGQLAEARSTYEGAAQLRPVTVPLLLSLARVAYKQKDWEGALGYLAHARDLEPKNAGIHFFFGIVSVELNLPLEAEKSLQKAVALDPDNDYYNFALGAVESEARKWQQAVPYFQKFLAKRPGDPRGMLALAQVHYYLHQDELARNELNEALKYPETAADAHLYLGQIASRENNYEEAVKELKQAVTSSGRASEAWAELGFAYLQLEQYPDAEKGLQRSLELNPDSQRANMVLLSLYQRTDDKRAEAQAKRVEEVIKKREEFARTLLRTVDARPY